MNPSSLSSSFSISPGGTSLPGVTELMKDTQFREFTKEMVKHHEEVQEMQKVPEAPAENPLAQMARSASVPLVPLVPVSLKLFNGSEKKEQVCLNRSGHAFIPRKETLVVNVHVEAPRRRLPPQRPRPGFLSHLSMGCLNCVKRCFGRPVG